MDDWQEQVKGAISKIVAGKGGTRPARRLTQLIGEYVERSNKQGQAIRVLVNRHNAAQAELQQLRRDLDAWMKWYDAHRMVRLISRPPKAGEVGGQNAQSGHVVSLGSPVITGAMVGRDAGGQRAADTR